MMQSFSTRSLSGVIVYSDKQSKIYAKGKGDEVYDEIVGSHSLSLQTLYGGTHAIYNREGKVYMLGENYLRIFILN